MELSTVPKSPTSSFRDMQVLTDTVCGSHALIPKIESSTQIDAQFHEFQAFIGCYVLYVVLVISRPAIPISSFAYLANVVTFQIALV